MSWSPLFDRTHILKGVPVDAEIELKCRRCNTLFKTKNAYHIGYAKIQYINPEEAGKCDHELKHLQPTNKWFPLRDIHKEMSDGSWVSLFDYSHILEGVPVDADIELECCRCKTRYYTLNTYYVGYAEIYYFNPEEKGKCNHDLKDLRPTRRWLPASSG